MNAMRLHEAIYDIARRFGRERVMNEVLVNYLADYQAFDRRSLKPVMRAFLREYATQLAELDRTAAPDRERRLSYMGHQLVQNYGFQRRIVDYVVDSLCYGLGWDGHIPQEPLEEEPDEPMPLPDNDIIQAGDQTIVMIRVTGGTFAMGATPEQGIFAAYDEKPPIEVTVNDFWLCEVLVTQALWRMVVGENPSHHRGDLLPVERVTWDDCLAFIELLNHRTGKKFRLPTEAEWEYAARGGTMAQKRKYAGCDEAELDQFVWHKGNSDGQSHEVRLLRPNELGLYDLCGNVGEWCQDWYFNSYHYGGSKINPKGPASGVARVYRGGSWDDKAINCRVSKRFSMNPIYRNKLIGLRLAASS